MPLDFRNCNTLWASVLVQTLQHLGLTTVVLCPGSRSAPLTLAFSQHPALDCLPLVDERSAGFFALGRARRSGQPVVLVCTSGTAGANFYPAVIEARESGVPLLVLTADRPPELRHCHAGQAIDQVRLFGTYPTWDTSLALPSADLPQLQYLRQTLALAWERTQFPQGGPVHLNCPFRDPLHPQPDPAVQALEASFAQQQFFAHLIHIPQPVSPGGPALSPQGTFIPAPLPLGQMPQFAAPGLIIVGPVQPTDADHFCATITSLARVLQWPVLADGLNPLRHRTPRPDALITTYDLILRHGDVADRLKTTQVLQIGELPASKELRHWLSQTQPQRWVISPQADNFDPLHGPVLPVRCSLDLFLDWVFQRGLRHAPTPAIGVQEAKQRWIAAEARTRLAIDQTMAGIDHLTESKLAWGLGRWLPLDTPLMVANSTPIRDWEWFCGAHDRRLSLFFNRGANGIDGTLSTALGLIHGGDRGVLLTGDLALLHDSNGFLARSWVRGHLTIILLNNQGGGIFELLPIAEDNPYFEDFFATPQTVDFSHLCQAHGIDYQAITTWAQLPPLLNPLPTTGIRLLELRTDRKAEAQWRRRLLPQLGQDSA